MDGPAHPHLTRAGWWSRQEVVDPKTGKTVVAQLGSSHRLQTIWRVNLGQASQAGRWERAQRSEGIDPGFEHNPGAGRERQLRTQWQERDRIFAGQMEPHPDATPVRGSLDISGAGSQHAAAADAIRAVGRVHGAGRLTIDPDSEEVVPLPIRQSDTTDRQGEYLYAPRTGRPIRIDLSIAGEQADRWPALIAAEEIGHYLDHAGMSGSARDVGDWESYAQRTREMKAVMQRILESPTYRLLPEDSHRTWPWELWGRAYAQYIARRSGSSRLKGELDKVLTHADPDKQVMYWPYDEYVPIAAAIDRLMEARTWARRKQDP